MTNLHYPAVVVELPEDDGGGFLAYAPDLIGCMGDGDTPEAALNDLQGAVHAWCAEMVRLGREIPQPGAASRAARAREETLLRIIRDQQGALERQGEMYEQLRAEVAGLKQEVDRVVSGLSDGPGSGADWPQVGPTGVLRSFVQVSH